MVRAQNPNLEILSLAVEKLGDLVDELVFVGGCATGLLITDAAAPPIESLLQSSAFVDAVAGRMPTDAASQARVHTIVEVLNNIARTYDLSASET